MPNDRSKVKFGPGKLYSAVVGSTEPTDLTTAWAVAWTHLGYTDEGSSFTYSPDFEDIEVAEENNPIDVIKVGEELTVEFALAQLTAANLQIVMNGGTVTTGGTGATTINTFEPLGADAAPVYIALGWENLGTVTERWVWRKCLQTGDVEIERRKGSDKATLPGEFRVIQPTSGQAFKAIIANPA